MAVLNDSLLDVARHRLDRLVQHAVLLGRGLDVAARPALSSHRLGPIVDDHPPDAVQKAADAADAVHAPGLDGLQRAHEHLVQPQRVGPVFASPPRRD